MARNENFDAVTIGKNTPETISGTGAALSFSGNDDRDIHDSTDVTLSNGTAGSVTEDVTVNYYSGIDATGTLIASETQSITLAAGASSTTTFLSDDFGIGVGDYFIDVTTTNLTVDSLAENTLGAEYITEQDAEGDLVTTDHSGRERARYNSTSDTVIYPTVNATDVASQSVNTSNAVADSLNTDEVNTTVHVESIPAAQAAIDANAMADGTSPVKIVFESGTYAPADADLPLQPQGRTVLEGAGIESTEFDVSDLTSNIIQTNGTEHVVIRDLSIWGNFATAGDGIRLVHSPRTHIENVRLVNLNNGIVLEDGSYQTDIIGCYSRSNTANGLLITEGVNGNIANGSRVIGGHFNSSTNGIRAERGSGLTFMTYCEANDAYGLLAGMCGGLQILSTFEKNGTAGIGLSPFAEGLQAGWGASIHGGHFNLFSNQTGVIVGQFDGVDFTANRFRCPPDATGTTGIHIEDYADNVSVGESVHFNDKLASGVTSGLTTARKLNGGVWSTAVFPYGDIITAASNLNALDNSLRVQIDGRIAVTDGDGLNLAGWPHGTIIEGVSDRAKIETTALGADGIKINRDDIVVQNLSVETGIDSQDAINVGTTDTNATIRDVTVTGAGRDGIRILGDNCTVKDCDIQAATGNTITVSGLDNIIENSAPGRNITNLGTRTLVNGWGTNAGNPATTGDWTGNGREGVNVYDTTNGVKYSYVDGGWR